MSSGSRQPVGSKVNRKKASSTAQTHKRAAAESSALAVQQTPQRVAALLHEHRLLLAKIRQKQAERTRLTAGIDEAMRVCQRDGLPLLDEIVSIDRQLHALFAELLARKKQPRKTLKIVREVYCLLQDSGQISPSWFTIAEPDDAQWESSPPQGAPNHKPRESEKGEFPQWEQGDIPPWAKGGVTANRGGESAGSASLRELFRRLASVLHPDKVQDDETKAERTEVMKELTQAYRAGDMARLIELEKEWLLSVQTEKQEKPQLDELEQRCVQLAARNRALRLQLEEEKAVLRELRRSPQAELLAEMKRMAKGSKRSPEEVWIQSLHEQNTELKTIIDFVRSYRDGKIDLDTFHRGPLVSDESGSHFDENSAGEEELLREVLAMLSTPMRRSKSRRSSSKQSPQDKAHGNLF